MHLDRNFLNDCFKYIFGYLRVMLIVTLLQGFLISIILFSTQPSNLTTDYRATIFEKILGEVTLGWGFVIFLVYLATTVAYWWIVSTNLYEKHKVPSENWRSYGRSQQQSRFTQ
ncbi:MAG: hypothetical protein AAF846_00250 [Chloroflexota bacterium]